MLVELSGLRSPKGRWCLLSLAIFAAVDAASVPAAAETATGQLSVSASVQSGCALTGGALDFGNYVSGQAAPLDAAGQIGYVNCTGLLTFELDGGQQAAVQNRAMSGNGASLAYQIYRSGARNAIWGVGDDALQLQLISSTPSSGSVPVYGRVLGGQAVPGGTYTDIVNITLTF